MLRLASLMRSAMTRRTPITLISVVSGSADGGPEERAPDDVGPDVSGAAHAVETCRDPAPGPVGGLAAARLSAAGKSPRRMRPPGPEPAMVDKSIPASRALRRLAGEAFTRPWLCRSAGSPTPGSCRPGSCRPGSGGPRSGAPMDAPAERIGAARSGAAVTSRGGGVGAADVAGAAGAAGVAGWTGAAAGAAKSNTHNGDPTAILSPGSPEIDTTR